jgi:hypothetical protein
MAADANQTTAWPPDRGDYDFDAIARVASRVELKDVRLHASTIRLTIDPEQVVDTWSSDAFIGFNTEVQERSVNDGQFSLNALFTCVFKRSWKDQVISDMPPLSQEDPPEIEIDAAFELVYVTQEGAPFTKEDLDQFARVNGTLHAWPFWRELAESAAQRMGIARLVIGVFKVPSTYDPPVDAD